MTPSLLENILSVSLSSAGGAKLTFFFWLVGVLSVFNMLLGSLLDGGVDGVSTSSFLFAIIFFYKLFIIFLYSYLSFVVQIN